MDDAAEDEWDVDDDGTTLRLGEFLSIGDRGIQTVRPAMGATGPAVVREAGLGESRDSGAAASGAAAAGSGGSGTGRAGGGLTSPGAPIGIGHAGALVSPTGAAASAGAATPAVVLRGNIRTELVMLDRLGVGASATVQRALHLPSLQVKQ